MKLKLTGFLLLSVVFTISGNSYYPGTVYLFNGLSETGYVQTIHYNSKNVKIYNENEGKDLRKTIPADSIKSVEIYNEKSPEKIHRFEYLKIKKNKRNWLGEIAKGTNVRTFIMAQGYEISTYGYLVITGTSTTYYTNNIQTMKIQPSYPVYMIKNGEEVATIISLHGGIKFEDSAFRGGVSKYLSDDSEICKLIRNNKLGFDDLDMINKLYNPNRANMPLIYKNEVIRIKPDQFFTEYFNKELRWKFEFDIPLDNQHGVQARFGLQSSFMKFFTYGFDVGYGSATFVEEGLLPPYFNNKPITEEYLVNASGIAFNGSLGTHLPMDLKSCYLVPGVSVALGALICENNESAFNLYYAPTFTLDVGLKLKYGNVVFIGAGLRNHVPIVSQEARDNQTYNGFAYYTNYNSLFLRIGYQF